MTKPYPISSILLLFPLFALPNLLYANLEPTGDPVKGASDSLATELGHCNPITLPVVNCAVAGLQPDAVYYWRVRGQQ